KEKKRRNGATFWIIILLLLLVLLWLKNCGVFKSTIPSPPPTLPQQKVEVPSLPPQTTAVAPAVEKKTPKEAEKKPPAKPMESKPLSRTYLEKQKGISFVTWEKDYYSTATSEGALKKIAAIQANWVGLHTTWYQDTVDSLDIHPGEKSPSDDSLIHAIHSIHSLGLKVMLKPQLDLIDTSSGEWRGSIEFGKENDWQAWFDSYTEFIVHYAQIAQEEKVEMLCIGTELTAVATLRPDLWKEKVIKSVRQIYEGPLTYAANWYEEYTAVKFWDALDYAGLDPYFPLSDKDKPTFEEIKKGWESHVAEIEKWQASISKPVIFTEIGYRSSTGAAKEPWEHMPGKEVDLQQQADCYEALFETFWDKPWLRGVYWWEWGVSIKSGGESNRGFTPQNKPAEQVLTEWYKKK
ncbi:MAG: hypothetical protein V1653_03110, partial [bacterium]